MAHKKDNTMIELSNNYVALNLAKFIYEEEAKLTPNKHQQESDIKEYIFELYEECVAVVEENDSADYEYEDFDFDEDESLADDDDDMLR